MLMTGEKIHVSHVPLDKASNLLADWAVLEEKSNNGFFQSRSWMSSWLASIDTKLDVIQASTDGEIVGLGLVSLRCERRHIFVRSTVLRLHQTGVADEDQVWVEYNDFLVQENNAGTIRSAMCDYLLKQYRGWDEFHTGAITQSSSLHEIAGQLRSRETWHSRRYGVDLAGLRQRNETYLQGLSGNTRYQLNRCRKEYQGRGEVALQAAESLEQALGFFDEMAPLHIARWQHQGGSGFSNHRFCEFHKNLIETGWQQHQVELLRLNVNNTAVAYLYNFIYRNKVYFYMGVTVRDSDPKLKPGMLAHAMCIEGHLQGGKDYYDFMGGDMRYKMSLASDVEDMQVLACAKLRPQLLVEDVARRARHFLARSAKE